MKAVIVTVIRALTRNHFITASTSFSILATRPVAPAETRAAPQARFQPTKYQNATFFLFSTNRISLSRENRGSQRANPGETGLPANMK